MAKAKRIFCVIAYDIQNDRRRIKIAKLIEQYGCRVNYSVFECLMTGRQLNELQKSIENKINPKKDTVIYYQICVDCFTKIKYQPDKREDIDIVNVV